MNLLRADALARSDCEGQEDMKKMKSDHWNYTKPDKDAIAELQDFLPRKVFDAHAHVYRRVDLMPANAGMFTDGPEEAGLAVWCKEVGKLLGGIQPAGGLLVPFPSSRRTMDRCNDFAVSEVTKDKKSRALVLVAPDYPEDKIRKYLDMPGVIGLKPYHLLSKKKGTLQAPLRDYLPESAWKIANERGSVILLHLVRTKALADRGNQATIQRMCSKYPNAKLILAHAARGFHPDHTIEGLVALKGLQNVWFDAAAVCETAAIDAILNEFGPRRLLWGSDFPISQLRGKCVSLGDGFVWLFPDTINWSSSSPNTNMLLAGVESLLALKRACNDFGLSRSDVQNIMCYNAQELLGIRKPKASLTQDLYRHAKTRIPGGVQLLSKRPEMFAPDQWPAYQAEARGCETWDLDGKHYFDVSFHGIGACLLGFRNPAVTRAVQRRLKLGSMSTLNPPEEVELADLLCDIHPWADKVRFARTGGECAAVAVRIARATTDRSLIAVCGYHGWHDWYLAANLGDNDSLRGHLLPGLDPLGVPTELRGTTLPFKYNDRKAFKKIIDKYGDRLAAVVMEPCRYFDPEPGFLEYVKKSIHRKGGLLIFDEITIGWRRCLGGSHLRLGVEPDMALFAKTISNGHPMAAVIATGEAMEGAHNSFISSAYWTEGIGPVAALTTIREMKKINVPAHADRIGRLVLKAWKQSGKKHNLPITFDGGYPCIAHFAFDHELADELKTFYVQLMLERGFMATTAICVSLAHTENIISLYATAIDEVFAEMAEALDKGDVVSRLKGPVAHNTFKRLL